jgi:hypothetical protein
MKPDRAIIRLSFPHPVLGNFFPVKIEYEYPIGPNDHEHDALDHGKASAEEWFKRAYPSLDQHPPIPERPFAYRQEQTPVIDYGKHDQSPDGVLADIQKSQTLEELATYKLLAGQSGLVPQYMKRVNELRLIPPPPTTLS